MAEGKLVCEIEALCEKCGTWHSVVLTDTNTPGREEWTIRMRCLACGFAPLATAGKQVRRLAHNESGGDE
jgi:hypothetical protein